VRAAMRALHAVALPEAEPAAGLEARILAATTTGEMLSCQEFDRLLERYFDGVILAPTFQNFQTHFESCSKCSRLLAGIEDAVAMCRDAKEIELDVPDSLHDRIVAATTGPPLAAPGDRGRNLLFAFAQLLWSPQMAAAALIFAASSLLVISRFGGFGGMADHAELKARRFYSESEKRINGTRLSFRNMSSGVGAALFRDPAKPAGNSEPPAQPSRARRPSPTPKPTAPAPDERSPDSSNR
jgi:hypothetical protein